MGSNKHKHTKERIEQWFLTFTNTPNPYVVFQAYVESRFSPIQQEAKMVYWNEINQQFVFNYVIAPRLLMFQMTFVEPLKRLPGQEPLVQNIVLA